MEYLLQAIPFLIVAVITYLGARWQDTNPYSRIARAVSVPCFVLCILCVIIAFGLIFRSMDAVLK